MDIKQFYGIAELTMADTNQTNAICWIKDDSFFYGVNLVYFTLIFVFNSGILMAVVSSICKMRGTFKHKPGAQRDLAALCCTDGFTVMGLTCLLGITWGLVFLGSGHVNYPVLYIFCILNSTQGFLIFLWICCLTRKQRKRVIEARSLSTPMKNSETKSN
ncbi:adhesion G-protein coupled receptor G2-like [Centroberyx affinis]|uniref:adhesion G-protein coupled receptor G2-like n=1 Tax=Centroberyx affinis TaxID=166261 RepID=UPI003A5C1295